MTGQWERLEIPCSNLPGEIVCVPPGWPIRWAEAAEGKIVLWRRRTRYRRFRDWLVGW